MKRRNPYIIFSVMGLELISIMGGTMILGRYIDQYMRWNNSALIACSLLGLIFWFYHFMVLLKKVGREDKNGKEKRF